MHPENLSIVYDLPLPKLRQELLRQAHLTLAEARALSALLDHLENGTERNRSAIGPPRAAFGSQLENKARTKPVEKVAVVEGTMSRLVIVVTRSGPN